MRRSALVCCGVFFLLTGVAGVDEGIELAELHAPNGQRLFVQPSQIVSIREPAEVAKRQFGPGTKCVVVVANGQFYAVRESCDTVTRMVERRSKQHSGQPGQPPLPPP